MLYFFLMEFRAWMLVVVVIFAGLGMAADGVPEVSRDVRAKAAIAKLKSQKQIALLYVKGMT